MVISGEKNRFLILILLMKVVIYFPLKHLSKCEMYVHHHYRFLQQGVDVNRMKILFLSMFPGEMFNGIYF